MVSSAVQKLLRNQSQSASEIFTQFRRPLPALPPLVRTHIPQITKPNDGLPFLNHPSADLLKPNRSFCRYAYPSFSFEFFLNPVSPPSLIRYETDDEKSEDDSRIIRADSVKKKRKRKMNKHKLRKLRKRLRKKT